MKNKIEMNFNSPIGPIKQSDIDLFAAEEGLDEIAPDRYCSLIVMHMMLYATMHGVDPQDIVNEIRYLEGVGPMMQTKPSAPFKDDGLLSGLHHKHFTSGNAGMVAANILAASGKSKQNRIAEEEFKSGISAATIRNYVARIVGGYEQRSANGNLTGEWIVFVEHEGKKYYLCAATHSGGDDEVLGYIRGVCHHEFPFLKTALPHLFVNPGE
jgi:hypothetical protein